MKIIESIKKEVSSFAEKPTIVYAEGWNKTIQEAAVQIQQEGLINPLLIFKTRQELNQFDNKTNIATFVIEENDITEYANLLFELRKNKGLSIEDATKYSKQPNYLACLLIKNKPNWGVICGIEYTTKHTLRAALQVVKPKRGVRIVSSAMILEREDKTVFMADIGLTINPNPEELAAIVDNTIDFVVNRIGLVNNNVAMLSYSSNGSGAGESVDKVKQAFEIYKNNYQQNKHAHVYGEIQLDAAVDATVRNRKCPNNTFAGDANVLIMPNLDAGNIGYKLMQRFAGFEATGPIILGLDKPVNDLSRGAGLYEVVSLSYVTALQTKN